MVGPRAPLLVNRGLVNMARAFLNFMSYNSTGLSAVKSDWICDTMKVCKIDLMQIQEHLKKNKNIDMHFKKIS